MLASSNPTSRSYRLSIATLVIGTVGVAVITFFYPHLMLVALFTMLMIFALLLALAIDVVIAAVRRNAGGLQFSMRQLLVATTCLGVYLSLLWEPWTFRLRFLISRPALQWLAIDVERGESPGLKRAGLFFIKKASREERDEGDVTVLWTEPEGGSPSGFVHPAPANSGIPMLFNDYSTALQSDPQWFYFIQD